MIDNGLYHPGTGRQTRFLASSGANYSHRILCMARVVVLSALFSVCQALAQTPTRDVPSQPSWSDDERVVLRSLAIDALPPLPKSPGNPVADDPRAIALGHRLFFDTRLGTSNEVSCATCHQPDRGFRDGLARGRGIGETRRRTMSIVGSAYSPWLFWDGRRDSLWSQALEPLEEASEHGGTRLQYYHLISSDPWYRAAYESLFTPLPDAPGMQRFPARGGPVTTAQDSAAWESLSADDRLEISTTFANIGRALEAYQRQLIPAAAPFDDYVRRLDAGEEQAAADALGADALAGLRLFIGEAQCIHCHNGPLFTNNEFHNTGTGPVDRLPDDRGRIEGVKLLQQNEFNCLGDISGAGPEDCGELRFVKSSGVELVGAFRTPSLRNVASTGGPYMHNGSLATLHDVLEHYNTAEATLISDDLKPLGLDETQLQQIDAFLRTLDGPLATDADLLRPPE